MMKYEVRSTKYEVKELGATELRGGVKGGKAGTARWTSIRIPVRRIPLWCVEHVKGGAVDLY